MKKSGKKGRHNKAANTIINKALDDLKTDRFEDSSSFSAFDLSQDPESESSSESEMGDQTRRGGFVDVSIAQVPDETEDSRVAPAGLSDDVVEAIQKGGKKEPESRSSPVAVSLTESVPKNTNSEATLVSSNDNTGVTQPMANNDDKTGASATGSMSSSLGVSDKTQPMYRPYSAGGQAESSIKVSPGFARAPGKMGAAAGAPSELQLMQAENLKLAQNRILELEKEVERLRQENELLFSAGDLAKKKNEELMDQISQLERSKSDALQQAELELNIFKDSLQEKEREYRKAKARVQELEARLATDLKKIRVRERDLENRLELARMERTTLLRSKDETLLELKRKIDFLNAELDQYKQKAAELSQKLEQGQDQMARTVRALRLALTNLEANGEAATNQLVVIKKAE